MEKKTKTIRKRKCCSRTPCGFLSVYSCGGMTPVTLSSVFVFGRSAAALAATASVSAASPRSTANRKKREEKETPSKLSAFVAASAFTSRATLWRLVARLASAVCLLADLYIYLIIYLPDKPFSNGCSRLEATAAA